MGSTTGISNQGTTLENAIKAGGKLNPGSSDFSVSACFDEKGNYLGTELYSKSKSAALESDYAGTKHLINGEKSNFKLDYAEAKNYNLDQHADELEMIARYGDDYKNASPREKLDFKEFNYLSGSLNECKNEAKVLEAAAKYIEGSGKTAETLDAVDKALINFCANTNAGKIADTSLIKKANGFIEGLEISGKLAKFTSAASKFGNVVIGVTVAVQAGVAIYNVSQALEAGRPYTAGSIIVGTGAALATTFIGGEVITGAIAPYLMGLGTAIGGPIGALAGGLLAGVIGYGISGMIGSGLNEMITDIGGWLDDAFIGACGAYPPRDPLIIDLGKAGISLTDVENGVHFDIDKNGFSEKTAWTDGEDGFLVLDRNNNGFIDDGGELFSDQVIMKDGHISKTGFEALAELDDNVVDEETNESGDGVVDSKDSAFDALMVWVDANHNGISEKEELKALSELGITSISLDYKSNEEEEIFRTETADVTFMDGSVREIAEHWFDVKTYDTEERDEEGNTVHTDSIESFGNVRNIKNAIEEDETGRLGSLVEAFKTSNSFIEKRVLLNKILYAITNSEDIVPESRGGNIDARQLNVIEQFMGREFVGVDGGHTPNSNAASILRNLYHNIEITYFNLLNRETDVNGYLQFVFEKTNEDGTTTLDLSLLMFVIDHQIALGENVDDVIYGIDSWFKIIDSTNSKNYAEDFEKQISAEYSQYSNIREMVNTTTVVGSYANDILNGTMSDDIIWGDAGDDTVNSGTGNDYINGGSGDDILNGGAGNDTYYFEKNHGNDVVRDTQGNNKLIFTDGISADDYDISIDAKLGFVLTHKETGETISMPDFLTNPLNYNFVFEGRSEDVSALDDREVIEGTDGDDYLESGDGFNIIYGGEGNDTLAGGKDMDFMYGGDGDDLLLGRNGVNVLFGGNGNDTIYDGDDGSYLSGGEGDDFLYGGGGADVLDGGAGNDYLQGDHGGDTYIFGRGYDTDTINASSGNNTIIIHGYRASSMINTRNAHNDLIINFGSADSTDCLIVDHFFDYNSNRDFNFVFDDGTVLGQYDITAKYAPIYGTDGDDWLAIQNGDNGIIHGGAGNDGLSSGSGNDELYGENGDDTLYGNDGNDILDGGTGNDTLCGGNGTDTYIFAKGYGNDTINEWGSDHSIVELADINSDEITVSDQWGSNLLISVNGTDDVLTISNFKWGQSTFTFKFADGAEGYVDRDTWQLVLTKQPDEIEDTEQMGAELLESLYEDDSLMSDFFTEDGADSTVITDVTESTVLDGDSDDISDMTDIQAMLLAENMSVFGNDDQVSDSMNINDITVDTSVLDLLIINSMN